MQACRCLNCIRLFIYVTLLINALLFIFSCSQENLSSDVITLNGYYGSQQSMHGLVCFCLNPHIVINGLSFEDYTCFIYYFANKIVIIFVWRSS